MGIQDKSFVGQKGEILPKKRLREFSGIKPGDEILIEALEGEIIIKKIYSIDEALSMPVIAKGTPESIETDISKERELQEKLTNDEE